MNSSHLNLYQALEYPQFDPFWCFYPQNSFPVPAMEQFFYPAPFYSGCIYAPTPDLLLPAYSQPRDWLPCASQALEQGLKSENTANRDECSEKLQVAENEKTSKTTPRRKKKNELENIKGWEKDRNILSNSLKLFLKHTRSSLREAHGLEERIIASLGLHYSRAQFEAKFNQLLPEDLNYVRPAAVKAMLKSGEKQFRAVLQISLRKFFKEGIYLTTSRSTSMKRSIKGQQIKAGRKLLQYFFEKNTQASQPNH